MTYDKEHEVENEEQPLHDDSDFQEHNGSIGGRKLKYDIFMYHFRKITKENGHKVAACNYCSTVIKLHKIRGYETVQRHLDNQHPPQASKTKNSGQTKISRFGSSSSKDIFVYSQEKNKECMACMVLPKTCFLLF